MIKQNKIVSFIKANSALIILLFISLGLRFYKINTSDLWFDEILTIIKSSLPSKVFFYFNTNIDPNLPIYFYFVKFWVFLTSYSEFNFRFISFFSSVISIAVLYKISEELFDKKTAFFSAFLLTISPFNIWYAQEARSFALFGLFILLLSFFFILSLKKDKLVYWILTCVFLIFNLYTSYWIFLFLPALSVIFLFQEYKHLFKKWILCIIVGFLFFLPYVSKSLKHLAFLKNGFWIEKPEIYRLLFTFENFNLGYTASKWMYIVSWILFGGIFVFSGLKLIKKQKHFLIFVSGLFIIPVFITFIISMFNPIYIDRHLIVFSSFYYIIIGYGLKSIKRPFKTFFIFAIAAIMLLSLSFYYLSYVPSPIKHHLGSYPKVSVKPVADYIMKNFKKGDLIGGTNFSATLPLWYYINYFNFKNNKILFNNIYFFLIPESLDKYWRKLYDSYSLDNAIDITVENNINKLKKSGSIWLVFSSWARNYTLDENSIEVRKIFLKKFNLSESKWIKGVLVEKYEK